MEKIEIEEKIVAMLKTVYDPEIPVNVYDLGLIYKIDVSDSGEAALDMTLTAPNCPAADFIMEDIRQKVDKWILGFSSVLSLVFVCINIFRPEIHNKTLMPALQSPWFTPHVIVYMFAYAMLGAATVMAVYLLWFKKKGIERHEMALCDNLTYVGLAFMTLGMLSGAVWAKAAWGHYWAWDPKETWAAATWFSYLAYIHFRLGCPAAYRKALFGLLVSFLLLQMCWYGINYLPSAQGVSVHTYNLN